MAATAASNPAAEPTLRADGGAIALSTLRAACASGASASATATINIRLAGSAVRIRMRRGSRPPGRGLPRGVTVRGRLPDRPEEAAYTSGVGFDSPEKLAIVFLIALIVFGPSRLPELGRSLGQGIRGFKDSVDGRDEPGDHSPHQP